MEENEFDKTCGVGTSQDVIDSQCAVNSSILDYYKKFGRKRDLEQFFSLSTAQSDIKDTSGLFWRKMKSENDSSDSGGRKSDSSHEVCRISIRCSLPDTSCSQDDDPKTKTESPHTESPPIIIEEVPLDADATQHTDDESIKSDDNNSQKSLDALLDLSAHKPLSPTSSITSQRKLEWDSLADVGYANESDRKTSASSLSTLERLALKQQYSNNDSKQNIGPPTSHSTPLDENEGKSKPKKGYGKKTTKIYKKDVDYVEVNVPHSSDVHTAPSINVNLTKHISFNVEKDGAVTVDDVKKDVSVSPEKVSVETKVTPHLGMDKEIQTSLLKGTSMPKEISALSNDGQVDNIPKLAQLNPERIPVMISLNTLRKRLRRKKSKIFRRKTRAKRKNDTNKEITLQDKSGEQLSEAESFEYMPGHMYNQNQIKDNDPGPDNGNVINSFANNSNSVAGNKSSLESSGPLTTDSSKGSKHSLTKDLEKCIDLLKVTLQQRYDNGNTKKQLIKEIVHRLVNSKYRDDDSSTDFLSGLSFHSKKLGIKGNNTTTSKSNVNNTTTSTSDVNNTDNNKQKRPKKSILRTEKFNPNVVASTSQSAPNLFTATSEKVHTNLMKALASNTESEASSRGKTSSENAFPKTSSEELYLKYLEALRREETYKQHLKDKEMFLKQKLVSSETAFKAPIRQESKISSRLKDLMKDLTRNNYDDGSGDASKLEGGSTSNMDFERSNGVRNLRSHSVFTLSSSHSECQKRPNLKKKMQAERELGEAGPSRNHYCCCPHHSMNSKVGYTDSSVQVNIKYPCENAASPENVNHLKTKENRTMLSECNKCKSKSPRNATRVVPDSVTGEIKYVCLCNGRPMSSSEKSDNFMIFKCSKLTSRGVQLERDYSRLYNTGIQCEHASKTPRDDNLELLQGPCRLNTATDSGSSDNTSKARRYCKSSQTKMLIQMMCQDGVNENNNSSGSEVKNLCGTSTKCIIGPTNVKEGVTVREGTRILQTEISIDPKISDPRISDIVIVNDCDCAKLIGEQYRQVSKNSFEQSDKKSFTGGHASGMLGKVNMDPFFKSDDSMHKEEIKSYNTNVNDFKNDQDGPATIAFGKGYTVPLQGTNMTLTVNLGAVDIPTKKGQVDQGVITEKARIVDEATSVNEELSQSELRRCACPTDHNSNESYAKELFEYSHNPYLADTNMTGKAHKSNTYPTKFKERPPLKRWNTDTDRLAVCTCVQTDKMEFNNNQKITICEKRPITQVVTCENAVQVDDTYKIHTFHGEDLPLKGLTRRAGGTFNTEELVQPDKIDMGIQKDTSDEKQGLILAGSSRYPSAVPSMFKNVSAGGSNTYGSHGNFQIKPKEVPTHKSVAIETDKETKTDKAHCVGCQTDNTVDKEKIQEKSQLDNGPQDTQEKIKKDTSCSKESCSGTQVIKEITRKDTCCTKESSCGPEDTQEKAKTDVCCSKESCPTNNNSPKDPIIDMIQDINQRYSKHDILKIKKKKCFTEIMTVLNYLLETEDSTDPEPKTCCSTTTDTKSSSNNIKTNKMFVAGCCSDKQVDKSVQLSCRKSRKDSKVGTESSDLPCSSDLPTTSSDSAACRVLNKIKKECEKYHQKKCKGGRKCEISSSTSVNCDKCKKVHHCPCKSHKCKRSKAFEKLQKKCIAYNLIIQTSESMLSEETICEKTCRPLKNIIVKVPKRKDNVIKEATYQNDRVSPPVTHRYPQCRSKSAPNGRESIDDFAKTMGTVTEYLVQNRPDFVQNTSERQRCLKFIKERRANQHATQRSVLSLYVEQQPDLTTLNSDELRQLAQQIGLDMRRKRPSQKFISEHVMKKHSAKIYKTLPEVVKKKEDKKKENIKKTNLLMANIFNKNLQKHTLRGSVNLSNYSTVIKF